MANATAIYGLFPNPASADRALNALQAAGISRGKIVVMASEPFDEYSFSQADRATVMPWLATLGGVIGGTCGYLLAAYTQEAYPLVTGGMPIVAPWPTGIVTYELTMFGAVMATVITLLITTGLPNWKPKLYDPEVSNGKILIGVVDPSDDARAELESRLRGAGADQVKVNSAAAH
jgi:membrane protein YqaA with SNARE-associated domain